MQFSPTTPIIISLVYVILVKKIGPMMMENRKPFLLKNTLLIYNFAQVLISFFILYETLIAGWATHYSWLCQDVERDVGLDSTGMRMARATHYYYLNKYIELLDTVFFVARKKYNQVTFLHVYHHGIMPIYAYIQARWLPGGHETFAAPINNFVHVVMYSYYFLSAAGGPKIQPYLWWKRYITALQLVQFVVSFAHSLVFLVGLGMGYEYATQCGYPWQNSVLACILLYIPFFNMFSKFYISSYTKASSKPKTN